MRVVVTGASGNVGTAVLRRLQASSAVDSVVGLARRPPADGGLASGLDGVDWVAADVTNADLVPLLRGADAVVHLAWLIQPSHQPQLMKRVNVEGSRRVFEATVEAGVPTLVYASSVGVYSPGPKDRRVDESWQRDGVATSLYGQDKAMVEATLDRVEAQHPELRAVRLRPGLIFQHDAGSEIIRYFLGRWVPAALLRPGAIPVLPFPKGVALQVVHVEDVAEAYHAALVTDNARGAYNVAGEPVLDGPDLARALGARPLPVPAALVRALADLTWRLHLQPTHPGWLDLGMSVPLMSTDRVRRDLGWSPRWQADDALRDLLAGMHERADGGTPVLAAR